MFCNSKFAMVLSDPYALTLHDIYLLCDTLLIRNHFIGHY